MFPSKLLFSVITFLMLLMVLYHNYFILSMLMLTQTARYPCHLTNTAKIRGNYLVPLPFFPRFPPKSFLISIKPDHHHYSSQHIVRRLYLYTKHRCHQEYIRVLHTFFERFHIHCVIPPQDRPHQSM